MNYQSGAQAHHPTNIGEPTMLSIDEEKLKDAAKELVEWPIFLKNDYYDKKLAAFRAEAGPAAVLALLAELEKARGGASE